MNYLKSIISYCLILTFALMGNLKICAQSFEGKLTYSIIYKAKTKHSNLKQLAIAQGDSEVVFIKKGLYKSIRKYKNDTIGTLIYNATDSMKCSQLKGNNYSFIESFGKDISERAVKTNNYSVLGNNNCEVYQSKKGSTTYTFYILKGSIPNSGNDMSFIYVINPFNGILAGLTIENPNYISTRFLVSKQELTIDNNVFDLGNTIKITSPNDLTNAIISSQKRDELQKCVNNNVKYPFYMDLNKLEGKVYIDLFINNEGKIFDKKVEADFFRETTKYDKITSKKRIERIRKKIQAKIIASLDKYCMNDIKLDIPKTKTGVVNTMLKIPIIFGNIYFDDRESNNDNDSSIEMNDNNDYHDFYENYD